MTSKWEPFRIVYPTPEQAMLLGRISMMASDVAKQYGPDTRFEVRMGENAAQLLGNPDTVAGMSARIDRETWWLGPDDVTVSPKHGDDS